MSPADELQAILDQLDRVIRSEHPELYRRFRPGLPGREVELLAEKLLPYHLPAELTVLYRWHDGWQEVIGDDYRPLLPDADFNSLVDAIASYEGWWDAFRSDGWHPLWFPAFGGQSGELVGLQLAADLPAGPLFSFHSELELETSYDSVAAFFATTLDCWKAGLMPYNPLAYPPEIREIAARHNPLSRTAEGGPRREVSRSSTEEWPEVWKDVLGIEPMVAAPDEVVVTIAEFVANPSCGRPIRGEVQGWGGSIDTSIVTVTDATGSLKVLLTREGTENYRELIGGRRFELWLAPVAGTAELDELDELAENMRAIAAVPAVSYLATRLVPLGPGG